MLIPLKEYIINWLDTYTVKDIFTGKRQKARDIFNWDKSYFLKLLIKDKYYIDTDIDFATKDKNYIKIIKKPLSKISPTKVKKYRYVTKLVPEDIIEEVIDYIPQKIQSYRYVYEPIYDTVIKKRKIGKKYYITTEYIETGKYRRKREYFDDIKYVERIRTKRRTVYKEKRVREEYYEQVRQRTMDDVQIQVTKYRYFEPFFVYDYYKVEDDDETYEHYIYIAPFFRVYGDAIVIGSDEDEIVDNKKKFKFIQPKELLKQNDYKTAVKKCRFLILQGKKNILKNHFRQANEAIEQGQELHTLYLQGSNKYSLDILELLFFKSADFSEKKVEII